MENDCCKLQKVTLILSTHAYVYLDTEAPIELFFATTYSDVANRDIYAGKDFNGVLRSIFIYGHYISAHTSKNSTDSVTYEYNRYLYEFITINNMQYIGSCMRINFA